MDVRQVSKSDSSFEAFRDGVKGCIFPAVSSKLGSNIVAVLRLKDSEFSVLRRPCVGPFSITTGIWQTIFSSLPLGGCYADM
jgi:hypothetical protein